ncbi:formyl-CoA transferase [Stella humosa]|uniref:Formyl-CoA transferase n=1 Tax=Stella humosa TaxID=94 RepID=A0A3N1M241_9PROT|nr:CoA transferase [Stella humosa]ROP99791.1 formyl-CoA transferase [Stella humosa]BBK30981.1 CoA transferase [Stella humosa]
MSMAETTAAPVGPLSGIKVLDLTSYLAGPYGCTLLADLGAEVIKIESPAGDMIRNFPSTLENESRVFLGTNRNKLGVVLDLKKPEARAALDRMVADADVIAHNFRPSVPERLGIGYDRLKTINPRLIYVSLTGFGQTGPMADNAGFDQVLQTMTGICNFQGRADAPQVVLGSIVDYYTSSLLAYGVSAALFHRERTGEGQFVGLSLLRTALAMQAGRFVWAEGEDRNAARDLRSGGLTGIHPTKDGHIYISAHSAHFWEALCELIGMPDLARHPRYDNMRKRAEHAPEILPRMRELLQAHTADEWEVIFGQRVPCSKAHPIEDMFDHPQVLDQDLVATMEHPVVGSYRGLGKPVEFSATPGPAQFGAPTFGQHTDEVLGRYGYSAEEIAKMRADGAVI